jgi:hypothetical protein
VKHDRDEKNPRLRIKRGGTLDLSDEIELIGVRSVFRQVSFAPPVVVSGLATSRALMARGAFIVTYVVKLPASRLRANVRSRVRRRA